MVSLAITLAALNSWTYLGFLESPPPRSEPAVAAIEASSRSEPAPKPPLPWPLAVINHRESADSSSIVEPARPTASSSFATEVRYRLADLTGQLWEHSDPNWLQEFVQARNRQILNQPRE